MFKVGKLEKVNNEKINIDFITQENNKFEDGKKVFSETFKTLSFEIYGDNYSFSFDLNCKLEELLDIPINETIDFQKYVFDSERSIIVNNIVYLEPKMDIKITRYSKNKFVIFLTFSTDNCCNDDDYSGVIEFTFNLDDYLNK